jgi:hypothetical protein
MCVCHYGRIPRPSNSFGLKYSQWICWPFYNGRIVRSGRNINRPDVKSQTTSLLSASFLDLDNRTEIDDLRVHWDKPVGDPPPGITLAISPWLRFTDVHVSRGNGGTTSRIETSGE